MGDWFSPSQPDDRSYANELLRTLEGQQQAAAVQFPLEAEYQPRYAQLAADIYGGLMPQVGGASVDYTFGLAPRVAGARRTLDPNTANLVDSLSAEALKGLAAGGELTPEQIRRMQQASRAAMAARGLSGSNLALADEMFRQYDLGNALQQQRQQFALGAGGLANQYGQGSLAWMADLGEQANRLALAMMPGQQFNAESPYAGNLYNANYQTAQLFAEPSILSKYNMLFDSAIGKPAGAFGNVVGGSRGMM